MSRYQGILAVAGGLMFWLAAPVAAQLPNPLGGGASGLRPYPYNPAPAYGPGYHTQLSPFLNFLRGGDPASNYFLGTIPEQQRRTNARLFGTAIGALQQRQQLDESQQRAGLDADLFTPLPTTGHPVAFGNYGGFYPQVNSLRRTGPAQPARPLNRQPGRPR